MVASNRIPDGESALKSALSVIGSLIDRRTEIPFKKIRPNVSTEKKFHRTNRIGKSCFKYSKPETYLELAP